MIKEPGNNIRNLDMLGVAILAGGKSTRMGTDKGLVHLNGVALIHRIASQILVITPNIFVVTNRLDEYRKFGYPMVADVYPDIGPLGGLYTALNYDKHEYTMVLSCDMPFVNQALLLYMVDIIGEYDAVVPRLSPDAKPEPLRAIYHKRCEKHMLDAITSGMRRAISFFEKIEVRYVERTEIEAIDPGARSFFNANTPEDLLEAGEIAKCYPLIE